MVSIRTSTSSNFRPFTAESGTLIPSILFDRAHSSRPAVICADRPAVLSYAELARLTQDVAAALRRQQVRARDRVAILLPTSIEFAAAFFGALTAEAVV